MDITTTIIPLITVIVCLLSVAGLLYAAFRSDSSTQQDLSRWSMESDLETEFTLWKNAVEDERTATSFSVEAIDPRKVEIVIK